MSSVYQRQQRFISLILTLSAHAETLKWVQSGGRAQAKLRSQRAALSRRVAALLSVATTAELAQLESRVELALAEARSLSAQLY